MENKFDVPPESSGAGPLPAGAVGVIIAVAFAVALMLILHGKSQQKVRDAQVASLEQELDSDKAALDIQKDKVVKITQQLDLLKQKFEMGLIKDEDKPGVVKEYHQLVLQQRAERDKYVPMADAYNAKVARLRELK